MSGPAPKSYANVTALRILQPPAAKPPPAAKTPPRRPSQSQTRPVEPSPEVAKPDEPEDVLDAKGNKRRQVKQDHKKAKEMIAEDARAQGVIVIPGAKPQDLDNEMQEPHPGHHENCQCMYCKCKFCASPSQREFCLVYVRCPMCQNMRAMLEDQMTESKEAHDLHIAQLLHAMSDLEKGLLEERRAQLEKQRKRREQEKLNHILNAQLAELKEQCAQSEKKHAVLRDELAREERIRKQHEKIDMEERRREGNFWMPIQ